MAALSSLSLRVHEGLHPQVQSARLKTAGRRSLILAWVVEGQTWEGEASPLPGFGDDSFERAFGELRAYPIERLQGALTTLSNSAPLSPELGSVKDGLTSPSARFAVEQCLLSALSFVRSVSIRSLLAEALGPEAPGSEPRSTPPFLPVSALVDPLAADSSLELTRLELARVRTIKLKVGRDLARERIFLAGLHERSFRVRLDPNQSLRPGELETLREALGDTPLEFVEDPVTNLEHWPSLAKLVPLAVDEPLSSHAPSSEFLARLAVRFVILKPMALGGYSTCLAWARAAREIGVQPLVSHLLDGPRALSAALELAFAIQDGVLAPGLGLHPGLEAWPRETWPRTALANQAGTSVEPLTSGFLRSVEPGQGRGSR